MNAQETWFAAGSTPIGKARAFLARYEKEETTEDNQSRKRR